MVDSVSVMSIVSPQAGIATAAILFVSACIVSDVRTLRIPNALTGPAILIGLALNTACFGPSGALASLAGLGLAIALMLTPFALGGIGGGDVKMMGAVGAFLGPALIMKSLLLGFILGGAFAIAHLIRISRLREKLAITWLMFHNAVVSRSLEPLQAPRDSPNAVALPYSVPLGIGTASVIAISVLAQR